MGPTDHHLSQRTSGRVMPLGLLLLTLLVTACAPTVDQEPYLQDPSSTSMVVRWGSSEATVGTVRYGTRADALSQSKSGNSAVFDQTVELDNLTPATRYYYQVSHFPGQVFSFKTPPPEGQAERTRVWILGDAGTGDTRASLVKNAFYEFNGGPATDLMLTLGDNAYESGEPEEFKRGFFDMFRDTLVSTPVFPAYGNHDHQGSGSPYFDLFTLPASGKTGVVPSDSEYYYAFNYANIHFVCLDSEASRRDVDGAMYQWLLADLGANTQDWTVVYFHQPPYSKGSHDSDSRGSSMAQMREIYTPVFEAYGVDLVFSGHSHSYERSFPLLGHQGLSDTFDSSMITDQGDGQPGGDGPYRKRGESEFGGVIYTVAGSSGSTNNGPLNHPAHAVSLLELGSVVLDFDGDRLDVRFVSPNPDANDSYSIVGGDQRDFAVPASRRKTARIQPWNSQGAL